MMVMVTSLKQVDDNREKQTMTSTRWGMVLLPSVGVIDKFYSFCFRLNQILMHKRQY